MGFRAKSSLGILRYDNGSLSGNNLVLCSALFWTLCQDMRIILWFLATVVCPPNSLSIFQFSSLFLLHHCCTVLVKELNCCDPLRMKHVGIYVEIMWCYSWSLFYIVFFFSHRYASTDLNALFYIPNVSSVILQKLNV